METQLNEFYTVVKFCAIALTTLATGAGGTFLYKFFKQKSDIELLSKRYEDITKTNSRNSETLNNKIDTDVEIMQAEVSKMISQCKLMTDAVQKTCASNISKLEKARSDLEVIKGTVTQHDKRITKNEDAISEIKIVSSKIDLLTELVKEAIK